MLLNAQPAIAALQTWYAADQYAAMTGLYHYEDPNLATDLNVSNKTLDDIYSELVNIYGYKNAFEDTVVWWNDANALATLIDYMLITNDLQYLSSVVENTFNKGPNAFTMSINGVEVGGLKGAAVGGAAGAADGSWAGPLGALVGGVIGGIIGFFVGGGSSASNNARVYYANFQTPYYDDEGWWALAWIKAYDLTLDPQYLKMAEFLFNDMTNGWDTTFGGGIFWAKDHKNGDGSIFPYKNAIANELFMAVATRLYLRTKELSYLTWAEKEWQWFYSSGLIATGDPKGTDPSCQVTTAGPSLCPGAQDLVYDSLTNVGIPDGTKTFWTYNCGVLLQALCDLYIITTNEELLSTAQGIAMAAIGYFQLRWDTNLQQLVYTGNSFNGFSPVLTERNPNSSVSTCHFKGILMRNLGALFANDPNSQTGKSIGEFITNNANSVLANLNPASQIGKEWNVMPDSVDFIRQSAGIDAINAANRVVQFTSPISLKATLARLGLNQTVQLKETIGWLTPSVRSWVIAFST